MHFIDPKTVRNWDSQKTGYWIPECIDTICGNPECSRLISFVPKPTGWDFNEAKAIITVAICSGCHNKNDFFLTDIKKSDQPEECGGIWQHPVPEIRTRIVDELPNIRVFKSYRDAIGAFNAGMWASALTNCGRVIEGIGKTTFPNAKTTNQIKGLFDKLRSELKKAPDFKELLEPFLNLGEALRVGRNPGGHFDLAAEPDRSLASKVIDLTEFLIRYVYLISNETSEVNELISKLGPDDADESELLDESESSG
jgi:hypothetical protein